ncbi:DUF692 family multinuclear iron-containing protein [Streptomyces griseorubiginosus]|uniref:multinuclear nonheme iron-dependent oxidase n=1 Tax=Streptomyces griseorubiginosus TaxID=67304 RepID=UPI0033A0BDEA
MTSVNTIRPVPTWHCPPVLGAGYLYHCIPAHQRYHDRLLQLGAQVDMIEYLASHFTSDPDYLQEVHAGTGGLPWTLHSYEYMIGSVDRPRPSTLRRLQRLAAVPGCQYIGEHVAMVGTTDTYSGNFLQPFGTDEQTQVFIDNLSAARRDFDCPLIVENQPQVLNRIGPRSVCEQVRDIAVGADTGVLLSLSNLAMSNSFRPEVDRERELGVIPVDRIWEVHVPLACEAELRDPAYATVREDERWALRTLEELCKHPDFRPTAVIFEIQATGTPSPAEPERTRDMLEHARGLLGVTRQSASTAAEAGT